MNLVDIVLLMDFILPLALIPLTTILPGALKNLSDNSIIRIYVRIGAAIVGIFPILHEFDILIKALLTTLDANVNSSIYTIVILIFSVISFIISWKLVEFGERVASYEHEGLKYDVTAVSETIKQSFEPLLQEFVAGVKSKISDPLGNSVLILAEQQKKQSVQYSEIVRNYEEKLTNYQELLVYSDIQITKVPKILEKHENRVEEFFKIKELYDLLISRVEALEYEKRKLLEKRLALESDKDTSTNENYQDTKLTNLDGISNRNIGLKEQEKIVEYLRSLGFEVTIGRGAGEPDLILKKNGIIVAIISVKSFMLYDEPKRMQRRISKEKVEPELILAKKIPTKLVIFVINRRNCRRWTQIIQPDDLDSWQGVSTPVVLAKDDKESGIELESQFLSVLASLGAIV